MRVREIIFRDFRNFRGERRISFVDPLTDQVHPITVIAGTNGTGKTTILDVVEAFLKIIRSPNDKDENALKQSIGNGLARAKFEVSSDELTYLPVNQPQGLALTYGRPEWVATFQDDALTHHWHSDMYDRSKIQREAIPVWTTEKLRADLQKAISEMESGRKDLRGGMILLPQERRLETYKESSVQPPSTRIEWIYHWTSAARWRGSLEEFWVWQDYLDLDKQRREISANGKTKLYLKSFVDTLEGILGNERIISVQEGRVRVTAPWTESDGSIPLLKLDQLPSGERQILLMFGELARRRRPGAIIMIDEPELNLHPTLQVLVMHQLRKIAREWDAQIIVATHSLEILRAVHESSRIYLDHLEMAQPKVPITD